MKVAELEGAELDYWVAKAEDWFATQCFQLEEMSPAFWVETECSCMYSPSKRWQDGGPIIERERIAVAWDDEPECMQWHAWAVLGDGEDSYGPTPLIAAMRCFVEMRFGKEVSDD